jgi:AFG3 family protein
MEILNVHLKPLLLDKATTKENTARRLAALTPGFSGADLANVCNEAAILAARRDSPSVTTDDFENACERVIGGLPKEKAISQIERETVAHHEAGHAVTGWFLEGADPVLKVSILPRSKGALGFAQFLPNETMLYTKEEILDKICAALGGRLAEEMFFGRVTTGAADDLRRVQDMASNMVTSYGMSEGIGMIGYDHDAVIKPFSQVTHHEIE